MQDPRLAKKICMIERHCLAVSYDDAHYEDLVAESPRYIVMAFYQDIAVGCCTARLRMKEKVEPGKEPVYRVHIMTLCTLEPYRRMGIGSRMLEFILRNVYEEKTTRISDVHLEAQVSSTAALEFYKSFNFVEDGYLKDYYPKLDCKDAYSLRLVVPQPFIQKDHKRSQ